MPAVPAPAGHLPADPADPAVVPAGLAVVPVGLTVVPADLAAVLIVLVSRLAGLAVPPVVRIDSADLAIVGPGGRTVDLAIVDPDGPPADPVARPAVRVGHGRPEIGSA